MAPLYSVYAEEPVTVAQLLGEEDEAVDMEAATAAAEEDLERMLRTIEERA